MRMKMKMRRMEAEDYKGMRDLIMEERRKRMRS